jgi:uncharacterized membrane protein (UPF0182 family)
MPANAARSVSWPTLFRTSHYPWVSWSRCALRQSRRAVVISHRSGPVRRLNYIRNSIKVVVDAYNGTVEFYVADPSDPIAANYRRIFPGLFKPFEAMPPELQRHIRYPEDLFQIQAKIYRAYHMDAPEVFYNRDDLWQFPRQLTGIDQAEGARNARMVPYYKEIAARRWRELKQKTKPKAARRS